MLHTSMHRFVRLYALFVSLSKLKKDCCVFLRTSIRTSACSSACTLYTCKIPFAYDLGRASTCCCILRTIMCWYVGTTTYYVLLHTMTCYHVLPNDITYSHVPQHTTYCHVLLGVLPHVLGAVAGTVSSLNDCGV